MKDKIFIDSNVLIYLASEQDLKKKSIVTGLMDKHFTKIVISTQVLGELFTVLKRKTNLSSEEISQITIKYSDEFFVENIERQNFIKAIDLHLKYQFSYYDSLIIASALIANCKELYSEDMSHNQLIDKKLRIINPFRN